MRVLRWPGRYRGPVTLVAAVVVLLSCWMLLVPPGAQPDEHSHLVRSAALVRGSDGDGSHLVPDRYRVADPGCYAFDPYQSASCAPVPVHVDEDSRLLTRADDYPPGGHLVFGLAGLLPGLEPVWWARGAAVAISSMLLGGAIVAAVRRRRALGAAVLFGVTPTAWSTMSAVNPSAFAISGSIALWTGLLTLDAQRARDGGPDDTSRLARWLVVGGWAALAVSRRDGLVWACIIAAFALVMERRGVADMRRRIGTPGAIVIVASTATTIAWGFGSTSTTSRLVVLAPLALAAPDLVIAARRRLGTTGRPSTPMMVLASAMLVTVAAAAWSAVVSMRRGGWSTSLFLTVVEQTDDNLIEAIGLLGWLDTPVPSVVPLIWLLGLGGLFAIAVADRAWIPAVLLIGVTMSTAWTFELLQGNESGTYWQGRYSLPLLVGVPIVLAHRSRSGLTDRIAPALTVVSLASAHIAVWAAGRRFGVGVGGSRLPWRWDTPLQPVPPVVLVVVSAVAATLLAVAVVRPSRTHR